MRGPADGASLGVIETPKVFTHAIEFSPDGSRLAVAASDAVTMWDVRSRAQVNRR